MFRQNVSHCTCICKNEPLGSIVLLSFPRNVSFQNLLYQKLMYFLIKYTFPELADSGKTGPRNSANSFISHSSECSLDSSVSLGLSPSLSVGGLVLCLVGRVHPGSVCVQCRPCGVPCAVGAVRLSTNREKRETEYILTGKNRFFRTASFADKCNSASPLP